jgi:hypothetical protein
LALSMMLLCHLHGYGQYGDAQSGPQPPCGKDPVPAYPALDEPAASKLWSRTAQGRDWNPPACTGWTSAGFTTLVTTVARFRYASGTAGGSDGLLRRIGAISGFAGMRYWSTTHQQWRVLIPDAYAVTGLQSGQRRLDFAPEEMKRGNPLYFEQADNLTGKGLYRMHIGEGSADRIVFDVENISTMRYLFLPVLPPGEMQSIYFLDRESENVWRYYSIARTGVNASGLVTANESSAINRAVAFYRHLAGIPGDQEPPAAR